MIHSRQTSSGLIETETPNEQPNYPYPDPADIPRGSHLLDDEQVNSQGRPVSSESGWQEAGTLSSRDDDSAMDFDDDRGRISDAGEDEEMLDCSDGGEEGLEAGGEPGEAFNESPSMIDHHTASVLEQREITQAALGCEVSRFFNTTTRDATMLARLAWEVTVNDSAMGPSAEALGRTTNTSVQVPPRQEARETLDMALCGVGNHASALTAGVQETFGSFVTEQTREAPNNLMDECDRYLESQPEQHHLANSGTARQVSPQDSGLGPFPGDFASPSTKDLDDMLVELSTPPASQSKVRTKSSKVSRLEFSDAFMHSRPAWSLLVDELKTDIVNLDADVADPVVYPNSKSVSFHTRILLLVPSRSPERTNLRWTPPSKAVSFVLDVPIAPLPSIHALHPLLILPSALDNRRHLMHRDQLTDGINLLHQQSYRPKPMIVLSTALDQSHILVETLKQRPFRSCRGKTPKLIRTTKRLRKRMIKRKQRSGIA